MFHLIYSPAFPDIHPHLDYRAVRVRVLFQLGPVYHCSETLAYIEWFTNFGRPLERYNRFRQISYVEQDNATVASIVPVRYLARSCFLTPYFGTTKAEDRGWTSDNVLDFERCKTFLFNSHFSIPMFQVCEADYELIPEDEMDENV